MCWIKVHLVSRCHHGVDCNRTSQPFLAHDSVFTAIGDEKRSSDTMSAARAAYQATLHG